MSWVVAAVLTVVSLPFLIARAAGGQPPNPGPKLAALAPVGIVPAVAGVVGGGVCPRGGSRCCWPCPR